MEALSLKDMDRTDHSQEELKYPNDTSEEIELDQDQEDVTFEVVHTVHSDEELELHDKTKRDEIIPDSLQTQEISEKIENDEDELILTETNKSDILQNSNDEAKPIEQKENDEKEDIVEELTIDFEDLKALRISNQKAGFSLLRESYLQASEEVLNLLKVLEKQDITTQSNKEDLDLSVSNDNIVNESVQNVNVMC